MICSRYLIRFALPVMLCIWCCSSRTDNGHADRVVLQGPFFYNGGHSWQAAVPQFSRIASNAAHPRRSYLQLYEDDRLLSWCNSTHHTIKTIGTGRYSHWNDSLYFSTSDNSNPNTNGRTYAVTVQVSPRRAAAPLPPGAPRIIYWYVIDALRFDAVEKTLKGKSVMPALRDFSRRSVFFNQAYVQSPFTKISTASWFTGLWPTKIGVSRCYRRTDDESLLLCDGLDFAFDTLAEYLREKGYVTFANLYTVHTRPGDGLMQGFDFQNVTPEDFDADLRVFIYHHLLGVHAPYRPSADALSSFAITAQPDSDAAGTGWYARKFEDTTFADTLYQLYLAECSDADRAFSRLREQLKKKGLWSDALVIVTADHGEEFLEHGALQHSANLYNEVLRVPLFVKFPQDSPFARFHGQQIAARVRLVDIFPTIADILESAQHGPWDGKSLLPVLQGEEKDPMGRPVVALMASRQWDTGGQKSLKTVALIDKNFKALMGTRIKDSQLPGVFPYRKGDAISELYDLEKDPREHNNLSNTFPEVFRRLEAKARELSLTPPAPPRASPDPGREMTFKTKEERDDTVDKLRALGYME